MAATSRAENASRNVFFGVLLKVYQILMPFVMRTVMIYFLGVEYLGLNGLFVSVLQFLNLAELGVGSAMVYSMYKPIAEDDHKTICALLGLYRRLYRFIGVAVLVLGLAIVPVLPHLIEGSIPQDLNLYWLYALYLGGTVVTYWLFAYKTSLLQAQQRSDIVSKVSLSVNTGMYVLQLVAVVVLKNYYWYVIAYVASLIVINVVSAICAKRLYPDLGPEGRLSKAEEKEIAHRIADLFTAKLGGVLLNAGPTVIVSAFLGLTILAIYQNYFFIAQSVTSLLGVVFAACLASIGNSIVTETVGKNYKDLKVFSLIMAWVIGFCSCCILCLTQPFMIVWVGEGLLLDDLAAVGFALYFLVFNMTVLLTTFKDAAGIWHQDRFRPLVTAVVCVALSLLLVPFWGVYGVIAATPVAQFVIAIPWVIHNLFSYLFERRMLKDYLKRYVLYFIGIIAISALVYCVVSQIHLSALESLIVDLLICGALFNVAFLLLVFRLPEFVDMLTLLNRVTKGRLSLLKRAVQRLS